MKFVRPTTYYLRALAIVQILTGGIALMPLSWLEWWHVWLGLHAMPNDAVLRYGIRGGAFVQAAVGVLLWVIATDVIRYRPLVLTAGAVYFVSGPAFLLIDSIAGMPRFWCAVDAVSCSTVGGILLALSVPKAKA